MEIKKKYPFYINNNNNSNVLKKLPLPDKLIIPLKINSENKNSIIVEKGQYVLRGQALTTVYSNDNTIPIHASTSGIIENITSLEGLFGLKENYVILRPDKKDSWIQRIPITDYYNYSKEYLLKYIYKNGINGIDNNQFLQTKKFNYGLYDIRSIKILIIQTITDFESYVMNITKDDYMINNHLYDLISGIKILNYLFKPKRILLIISDKQKKYFSLIEKILYVESLYLCKIHIVGLSRDYEISTSKLINSLSKNYKEILMLNIDTIYAIKRVILDGEALTERLITLINNSRKILEIFWIRLGTPISYILNFFKIESLKSITVIIKNPFAKFKLSFLDFPIITINSISILEKSLQNKEIFYKTEYEECILCGKCIYVCPMNLLPMQLYWFSCNQYYNYNNDIYNIFNCIECGACADVCPSKIPLVYIFIKKKKEIYAMKWTNYCISEAKFRYEAKKKRCEKKIISNTIDLFSKNKENQKNKEDIKKIRKIAVANAITRAKVKKRKFDI